MSEYPNPQPESAAEKHNGKKAVFDRLVALAENDDNKIVRVEIPDVVYDSPINSDPKVQAALNALRNYANKPIVIDDYESGERDVFNKKYADSDPDLFQLIDHSPAAGGMIDALRIGVGYDYAIKTEINIVIPPGKWQDKTNTERTDIASALQTAARGILDRYGVSKNPPD